MELLTISQIARSLGVPESTVRYYRDRFEENLPYVGTGRSRRYLPEAVDTLKSVMAAVKNGAPLEEVRQSLETAKQEVAATATATLLKEEEKTLAFPESTIHQERTASTEAAKTSAEGHEMGAAASTAKPKKSVKASKAAVRAAVASGKSGPIVAEKTSAPDHNLQAYQTLMVSEMMELHEQIDTMKEMLQTLIQEHAELQIGERDKQLVEALKGLQSMKTASKRRWFGRRG